MEDHLFVPVLRPRLPAADRILPYLRRIDAARVYTNWGPLSGELEHRLASHFGLPSGTIKSAASGTAALTGAILAAAGRATSQRPFAMIPAFTFVATGIAVEQCGYAPLIVDVNSDSWGLEPERLERHPLLPQTGLVVVVAPFGRAVPQAAWLDFSERLGIPVVIDAAGCFEAIERDPRSTVGVLPMVLSFHATKSFSTAEGGCVITTDPAMAQRVWSALNFGFESSRDSAAASTNGKMSEYHAAIGLAELDGWTEKRASLHDVARKYRCAFDHQCRLGRLWVAPDVAACYALLEVESESASNRVRERLEAVGLDSRLWYGMGLQDQTHFRDCRQEALTVAQCLAPRCIGLPIAPDLPDDVIRRVVNVIREAL